MARPPEVTLEEIIDAGQALQREKRRVSGFTLRSKTLRGRPEYLSRVWEQTQAGNADSRSAEASPADEPPKSALPPALAELCASANANVSNAISAAVSRAWKLAEGIATGRVEREHQEAIAEVDRVNYELAAAAAVLDAADRQAEAAEDALETRSDELRAALEAKAMMSGRLEAMSAAMADSTATNETLRSEITKLMASAAASNQDAVAANARAQASEVELVRLRVELTERQAELNLQRDATARALASTSWWAAVAILSCDHDYSKPQLPRVGREGSHKRGSVPSDVIVVNKQET